MNADSLNRIEKHYEREYEKNYTRRRHTHDLIFRVLTTHLSIVLAVLAAMGFLMKGERVDRSPTSLLIALLSAAIGTGILFFLSIVNLHISRDLYRHREKVLYRILEYLATHVTEPLREPQKEELAKLSKDYTSFGRIDMTQNVKLTSLFTLFRGSIYLSNALLAAFLAKQISPNVLLIVTIPATIVLFQYLAGIFYKKCYLAQYAQHADTPGGARDH